MSCNQVIKEPQEKILSVLEFIKQLAYLLPIVGIFLIVLGYGRMTGLAVTFGFSTLELVDDKADFLYEASLPLVQFYTRLVQLLSSSIFWTLILCIIGLLSIFYIIIRCLRESTETRSKIKAKINWVDYFFESSAFNLGPISGFIRAVIKIITEIFTFMMPIWLILFVLSVVMLVGLGGYYQGTKLANDYIINAKKCSKNLIKATSQEKVAICVAVFNDKNEIARGRVIANTKERIFLYVKNKNGARVSKSYPIRNAIIEQVDSE